MSNVIVECCHIDSDSIRCEKPVITDSSILELCFEHYEEWKVEHERKLALLKSESED
tara:strand:- start:1211 stop:1381 length:171 start_codon:yes stop_codon:yes gene_type:complete